MATYKLTYFNLRGIAEPIRLLFAYAQIPFEDIQVDCRKWPELKKDYKWQQLPYLEFDGKTLYQSTAILNYLARKFGLFPGDPLEQARVEEIMGAVNDLRLHVKPLILAKFVESNPESAQKIKHQLVSTTVPMFLENLNEILIDIQKNVSPKSDFILGGEKPTSADFYLAHFTNQWETILEDPDLLAKYEQLKLQQTVVYNLPRIAEWIEKRPKYFI